MPATVSTMTTTVAVAIMTFGVKITNAKIASTIKITVEMMMVFAVVFVMINISVS